MESTEFAPAPEVVALRDAVRDHCRRTWTDDAVRAVSEDGAPAAAAWRALGGQLGVLGLVVPERWGGGGAGLVEAAVVAEELGAVLAPVPYVSTVLAARLLLDSGGDSGGDSGREDGGEDIRADLLPGLCDGTRTVAVAASDEAGRWGRPSTVADRDGDRWLLTGTAGGVLDAPGATDLLVATADGALFHVDAAAVETTPVSTMDLTRPQGDLRFDRTPARRIGAADLARAADAAVVAQAAELVGVARAMLDDAVAYAGERVQFGRPIGSFQAVKHRCADLLVELELARSAAAHAAWTHDHGGDDPALAASLAQVVCADAARRVTAGAVQVFGGVAITWEHRAHRYYKRAVSAAALWGGRANRARLAELAVAANTGG